MWLRKRVATVALIAVGGLMAAAPSAFAANENASCVGAGSSALAPGQQEVWGPGTRADVSHYGISQADLLGITPGAITASFAQEKGSALECFPNGPPLP